MAVSNVVLEYDSQAEADADLASIRKIDPGANVSSQLIGIDDAIVIIAIGTWAVWLLQKIRDWPDCGIMIINNGKRISQRKLCTVNEGWILYIDPKGAAHVYDTEKDAENYKLFTSAISNGQDPPLKEGDPKDAEKK
jgi:hypothetical protein